MKLSMLLLIHALILVKPAIRLENSGIRDQDIHLFTIILSQFQNKLFCEHLNRKPRHAAFLMTIGRKGPLTHWGRVTHICVSDLTSIGADNGLSPCRRQAIIRTNAGLLWIEPLGTNFSKILIEIQIFSFKKMRLKVSSAKRRPFCLGLNVLTWRVFPCRDIMSSVFFLLQTLQPLQLHRLWITVCLVPWYHTITSSTSVQISIPATRPPSRFPVPSKLASSASKILIVSS